MRLSCIVIITVMNAILFGFTMFLFYGSLSAQYIDITYLTLHEEPLPEIKSPQSTENEDMCACNRPDIKIFNLGLMKAGSVSFSEVMRRFGCRSVHHGLHLEKRQDPFVNVTRWRTATIEQRRSTTKKTIHHVIPRIMLLAESNGHPFLYYFEDNVNAFSQLDDADKDQPLFIQMTHFDVLHQQYPGAKYILMKRNITNHIASIDRWGNLRKRITKGNVPYLPRGKGKTDKELRAWIESHYRRVHDYFTRFAPDQYLEIQLEDDDEDKITAIRQFLHCQQYNFSMVHGNHNNATGNLKRNPNLDLSHLSKESLLEKYHDFEEEMGLKDKQWEWKHSHFGRP